MKCPRCGNEQTDGAFCTKCGAPMNQNNGYNAPQQQQNNNYQQPNMNNGGYIISNKIRITTDMDSLIRTCTNNHARKSSTKKHG